MTATEMLRKQVKKYIDTADENSLRRVNAILEIDRQQDFWDTLPAHVKDDVEEALLQSERGEGNTHEDVMKKYDKWRTK
jgi:predicted transcriptional regulator